MSETTEKKAYYIKKFNHVYRNLIEIYDVVKETESTFLTTKGRILKSSGSGMAFGTWEQARYAAINKAERMVERARHSLEQAEAVLARAKALPQDEKSYETLTRECQTRRSCC